MEGLTSRIWRRLHAERFGGADAYYVPFTTPTALPKFTDRQLLELASKVNAGLPVVPQLLTADANNFGWAVKALADMGYNEVNLNMGCPSGTVDARGRGAGMLREPWKMRAFLEAIFAADPPLAVYVNLSARQFREPDLPETVSRILRETGLDPSCLHLEITETTAMSDAPATVSTLESLKALGVRLVIDDFGTGYSSLSYLQRFPVDYVKIDRSFVGDLERAPEAIALVSGMIGLAHALGIEFIAEGVERAGQLERLEAMGCDMAQGYYFSGPLPGEAMGALLEDAASG